MLTTLQTAIQPLHREAMEKCQLRLDNLTKPLHSLHHFEQLALKMAGITGNPRPTRGIKKSIVLLAGDHKGAIAGSTLQQLERVQRICKGQSPVTVFAQHVGAELQLVDIGLQQNVTDFPGLRQEKVAAGTEDILKGKAMSPETAVNAIKTGIRIAREESERGIQIMGIGEVGRASRVAAGAIVAYYTRKTPEQLYPINQRAEVEKVQLEKVLQTHSLLQEKPLDLLCKVGSLELAGLVGLILGGAAYRVAVVLDGLVTTAAALLASEWAPLAKDYIIGSHFSSEQPQLAALEYLEIPAYLHLDMDMGDGTGAALGMTLLNASFHVLNDMKTFGAAQVAVAQDGPGALRQSHAVKE